MAVQQNRLSRFWYELKRRRVLNVITVYASASFAIIEIIGNLAEPLNLPASLSSIVIIVLAVGFPPAIILSWLYDLTSGTFERTKPLDETVEEVKSVIVPNVWKIATYISFVVIVGLVVINITSRANVIKRGSVQSLVILPFGNLTGDTTLNAYIEGMHSLLISKIGEIAGLNVVGRATSDLFKNTDKSIQQITKELKVDAAMEFDVLCFGEIICFQPRLLSGGTKERQLWNGGEYCEQKGNLLNVYNQFIIQIADKLKLSLSSKEEAKLAESKTINPEAIDAYLKGYYYSGDFREESLIKARNYLNDAIEKEPDFAPLYAIMADVWGWLRFIRLESPETSDSIMNQNINKALALDPDLADAHRLIAVMASREINHNWKKSENEYLKALDLNPSNATSQLDYSILLYKLQRPDQAKKHAEIGYKLDPLNPVAQKLYALALLCGRDYTLALSFLENLLATDSDLKTTDPDNIVYQSLIENAAFGCGNLSRMFEATKQYLTVVNSFEEEDINEIQKIYTENGFIAANTEIVRRLELMMAKKITVGFGDLAFRYYVINQDDKAIEYLEKSVEVHDGMSTSIGTGFIDYSRLYDNPRFIALLKKMNLPLPKSN